LYQDYVSIGEVNGVSGIGQKHELRVDLKNEFYFELLGLGINYNAKN
jgi:hypothetical protein